MHDIDDVAVECQKIKLPFEYKWLEFRLRINKELYDAKTIDLKLFKLMEQSLLARLAKIRSMDKYSASSLVQEESRTDINEY